MVLADGSIARVTPEQGELFSAAAVSLGLLGIIVRVWLKVQPQYWLAIDRRRRTFESVLVELPRLAANNRNYEFFWFPDSELVYEKTMNVVAKPAGGGSGRTVGRWVSDVVNENLAMWLLCTINHTWPSSRRTLLDLGSGLVPQGSSVTRADGAYATERLVVHHETEWAVPVEHVVKVLQELHDLWRRFPTRTLFPIEVRFTRRDELMLSPSYGRDVAWIAVHTWWKEDYAEYFDAAAAICAAAGGRPHWGKLHGLGAQDFQRLYPKALDFDRIRRRLDPGGVFQNHYLKRLLPVALP
jgi:FAD/FMN-containing dehydrogenase